jgi:hypothetical protein
MVPFLRLHPHGVVRYSIELRNAIELPGLCVDIVSGRCREGSPAQKV